MKLLFSLCALLLIFSAPVLAMDGCYSGAWYEPATSGEGIDIQVSTEKVVLYRYAYLNGVPNYWVTNTPNSNDLTLHFVAYQTLMNDGVIDVFDVGSISLTPDPDDTKKMRMSWDYDIDLSKIGEGSIPWCLTSGCAGSKELVSLFRPTECE